MSAAPENYPIKAFYSLLRRNRRAGEFVNVYSPILEIGMFNAGL